ncbi:hypothetical protein FQR65_LT03248 [Abscondita terminalis]|nr:hypothetical protein FQR65_LT03248 [Abscondita terminalis]
MQTITEEKATKWWEIVTSMLPPTSESITQWNEIYKSQINEICDDMISEAISKRDDVLNDIEKLLEQSSLLCKELNIKMPDYGANSLTLYDERDILANKVNEFQKQIETIQRDIKKFNKEEMSICKSLGYTPKPMPLQPLPDQDTILQFKNYLDKLESKKFEREEQFLNTKAEILDIVNELKYKPSLDFERMVISADDSLFMVTDANMKRLNEFRESLKQQFDDTKERILNQREKLRSLWDLLNEDLGHMDSFLKKNNGYNFEVLDAFEDEVLRCENLKKANIEVFVQRLRKELVSLWDKCHVCEKDREKFVYFNSDTYSEDLLSIHDLEITKMKDFYDANCDMIKLLDKRSELWARMLELEESASMPERFKNRGGQLLKEEKERNALAKRLPKIEDQLLHLANNFESKYGKHFYSWGKTIIDIIQEAHHAHEKKKLKSSARKQKRDQTPAKLTLGITSSMSTQNLALSTHQSGVKRKLLTPSGGSAAKVLCEHNERVTKTAPSKVTITVNGKSVNGRSKYSIERAKRIDKCRRISQRMLQKQMEKENTPEYDSFEKDLGSKAGCRSTIFKDCDDTNLAVPLPITPNSKGLLKTPRSDRKQKFTAAPSFKLQF